MKIKIVDDSSTIRKTFSVILKKSGYSNTEAVDGLDGLLKSYEDKPDILFIDVMMPKINGYQLCETIKKQYWGKDIFICMLTGRDTLLDRAKVINSKADFLITKPFKNDDIIGLIKKVENGDYSKISLCLND